MESKKKGKLEIVFFFEGRLLRDKNGTRPKIDRLENKIRLFPFLYNHREGGGGRKFPKEILFMLSHFENWLSLYFSSLLEL